MKPQAVRRVAVVGLLAAAAIGLAAIVSGGDDGYILYAKFRQAGGLRKGFTVRIDGAPVGKIADLTLDKHDLVVAKLRLDKSAAPVGRDVHATARAADLLGEKFVDIDPGNLSDPAPSGTVIPPSRTGLAVELDDVINAIDLPTREALRTFINEQGTSFVGRGRDLATMLAALPPSLDRTGQLLAQFGSDNRALGRSVDESNRVVGAVARQRGSLGRLVSSASGTLQIIGRRGRELGDAVDRAPAALASARRALASLQGAAIPLGAAANGLRATAPALTTTLRQLPAFTAAARPTLQTVREVTPALQRLGSQGAPVVTRLQPLAGELATFSTSFNPVTKTLDSGIGDILGVLEGWARATQGHDAASHIFRFGLTTSPAAFADLAGLISAARADERAKQRLGKHRKPAIKLPPIKVPGLGKPKLPPAIQNATNGVRQALDEITSALGGGGDPSRQGGGATPLLDYLLK